MRQPLDAITNVRAKANIAPHYRDHDLSGDFVGYRECHLKPDLLLIYKKLDNHVLRLARLGSHSELFG